MSAENWHEERDRLVRLLRAMESGEVTHIECGEITHTNEDGLRQLQSTKADNITVIKERLAKLDARLGDNDR